MHTGIQLSSFAPLMTDQAGLNRVLGFMASIGARHTAVQWVGRSITPDQVGAALKRHGITSHGVQEKSADFLRDADYHLALCAATGGGEVCVSGVPGGDAAALANALAPYQRRLDDAGLYFAYHPLRDDLINGSWRTLQALMPHMRLTIDTFHVHAAGLDVADFILAAKGRVDVVHFKDRTADGVACPAGQGVIDLARAYDACRRADVTVVLAEQEKWQDAYAALGAGYSFIERLCTNDGYSVMASSTRPY